MTPTLDDLDGADEPISVVPFPTLAPEALQGRAGELVNAVMPYTEAHPGPVLAQLLARYGATVGDDAHMFADNRKHPARVWPLVVGATSTGAKGTSSGVVNALLGAVQDLRPLTRISGLSSGEGLIEVVRDGRGDNPDAKNFDEGVADKRLYVEDPEFTSTLAVMERQGSTLPRVLREAWDGDVLRTTTRSPLVATGAHIVVAAHVTPGELKLKLSDAQLLGGTMNRFVPVASRRTKLCPDGGNIPQNVISDCAVKLAKAIEHGRQVKAVIRTEPARKLWHREYATLRKAMPDGPVAKILARAVPQVLRLSLTYALIDGHDQIGEDHLHAALALWQYATDTATWMFGGVVDHGEIDQLVAFIAAGGNKGRTRTEIRADHFQKNRSAADINTMLAPLLKDGHVRQEVDNTGRGRPVTRYYAC